MREHIDLGVSDKGLRLDKGALHLLIALVMLPGYFLLGPEFKAAAIPYVVFLVLSRRAAYLPAVLIHFMPGTIVSQCALLACAFVGIINFGRLGTLRLRGVFLLTTAPMLLLLHAAIDPGRTIVEVAQYLDLYLGLFAFFYGAVLAEQMSEKVVRRVFFILVISLLMQILGWPESPTRYYFFAVCALTVAIAGFVIPKARWTVPFGLVLAFVVLVGAVFAGLLQLTFIVAFSALIATALILSRLFWGGVIKGIPIGKLLAGFALISTIYLATPGVQQQVDDYSVRGIGEIESVEDLLPALRFKLLGDRSTLWVGAWDVIRNYGGILPPSTPPPISYYLVSGSQHQVNYGAHNIGLELLRCYGWLVGLICILVYLIYLGYIGFGLLHVEINSLLFPILAVVMSLALVGGMFGHFVLGNNFSLLLLSLAGAGYGSARLATSKIMAARQ